MPIQRYIVCDACGEFFFHEVESRRSPNPSECPVCHNTGEVPLSWTKAKTKASRLVTSPLISKPQNQTADRVYRAMESSSDARAQEAADMVGASKHEMSHIKITDMNDNMREGDIAFKPSAAPPPAMQMMQANPGRFGMQSAEAAQGFGQMTKIGPAAGNHGDAIRQQVGATHQQRAHAVQRNGEMGRHKG